ncbi:hypothetical protein D3C75_455360 [compost metagenome]
MVENIRGDQMLYGFLVTVLIILLIVTWRDSGKKIANAEIGKNELPDVLHTYREVNYLGGHPLVSVGSVNEGALFVAKDKVFYMDSAKNSNVLFEISIDSIIRCSVETKESLTAGRILLVGILAWAFKKYTSYVRIEFLDELKAVSNIVLTPTQSNFNQAAEISSNINQIKLLSLKTPAQEVRN